jgi:hypothetical protein
VSEPTFEPNDAWIVFRLNSAPLRTRGDGDFNCFAAIDAATLLLHAMEMVPVAMGSPDRVHSGKLLKTAHATTGCLPRLLMIADDDPAEALVAAAEDRGVEVARAPADQIAELTREAREFFAEQFGGSPT